MSVYATSAAWDSGASGNELLVLLRLADTAGDAVDVYGNACEAVPTIAARTGLSDRTVQRCLRQLEGDGRIVRTGQHVWGPGKVTNVYRVVPDARGDRLTPPVESPGDTVTPNPSTEKTTANGSTSSGSSGLGDTVTPANAADTVPDDFPAELRPHARAAMRVLLDLAGRKGAKRPTARSLALVMQARPTYPLVRAAHDYAAWADAPSKRPRDVVAGYRNWLDRCDPLASTEPLPGQQVAAEPGTNVTRLPRRTGSAATDSRLERQAERFERARAAGGTVADVPEH